MTFEMKSIFCQEIESFLTKSSLLRIFFHINLNNIDSILESGVLLYFVFLGKRVFIVPILTRRSYLGGQSRSDFKSGQSANKSTHLFILLLMAS